MNEPESTRLAEDARRERYWTRWGPYLAERQWATVREDVSVDGNVWESFPHDHARSRAYVWGEDGLLGITDRGCRMCFALALWNTRDPILKERLFGLTGAEGNHGEDVKECYYYLDATPTNSYLSALYKYPHAEFPYERLRDENAGRSRLDDEFELLDTGVFDDGRYFDVQVEYAKAGPEDVLILITAHNRAGDDAPLHLLPTLWFRNTWQRPGAADAPRPWLERVADDMVAAEHPELGRYRLVVDGGAELLFTDNETNTARLFGVDNATPHTKDAFHLHVVDGSGEALRADGRGTKAAAHYRFDVPAGGHVTVRLRLTAETEELPPAALGADFDAVFSSRRAEADAFYAAVMPGSLDGEERAIARQAYAGLAWNKQFYEYDVAAWLAGAPGQPPRNQYGRRNENWTHLFADDVLSMPDSWEFPWFAAWDLAFHMVPQAAVDPHFVKDQLVLLLREWYMHPNGQIPAYEFAFDDVNPPVHAWACWRVYQDTGADDRLFLSRTFQKLVINFTWWVNRKDADGRNLFQGGFLGLDNIGVFDRGGELPSGGVLEQADATGWMAFYCATMLQIALELSRDNPATEDMASKFLEHFVAIADAINGHSGVGLWDEEDGFYYDHLHVGDEAIPIRVRSLVGLLPLLAVEVLDDTEIDALPGFRDRLQWFLENRPDLARHISWMCELEPGGPCRRLLAIPSEERLRRMLTRMLDEDEFLSPHGIRSLSKAHADAPFVLELEGTEHSVGYEPAESRTDLFGGNSNWRGPVWFPINYLLVEALRRYHSYYGDSFRIECPTGSGREMHLGAVADEIADRLIRLFERDPVTGRRPCHGGEPRYADDLHWRDLVLFYEHFCGDTGRGLGASHQTGWTALVARLLEDRARRR